MPFLIITCGPTGSGKTTLAEETAKKLGLKQGDYDVLLVDALIENNPDYKKKIDAIIEEYKCEDGTCMTNPTADVYAKFGDAYFSTRKQPSESCGGKTCDEYFDVKYKDSIKNRRNIVFESTCGYYPKWLLSPEFTPEDYNIVFSYSLVTLCNLIQRNSSRAAKQLEEYLKNKETNPAPRLPDVRYETMKKTVEGIKKVLISQTLQCGIRDVSQECVRRSRILIFDNNTKMTLIYDSEVNNPDDIRQVIDKKADTSETCGMGGYKSRKLKSKVRSRKQGKTARRRIRNGSR